jgi:hypothetical protein
MRAVLFHYQDLSNKLYKFKTLCINKIRTIKANFKYRNLINLVWKNLGLYAQQL